MAPGFSLSSTAGLDLGSYSVKALVRHSGPGVERWSVAEVPVREPGSDLAPDPERVASAIDRCLSDAGSSYRALRGVATGIAGPHVVTKQLSLPPLEDREVGPALRFEARKHVPFDAQRMVIDYQVLGSDPADRRLQVLLAAVSEDQIEHHLAPLRLLGAEPHIVDATPLALTNALLRAADDSRDAQALLDIGHASSHLTLYQPQAPYFTRRLEFGGRHLTQAIAAARGIPPQEAETWKLGVAALAEANAPWDGPEWRAMLDCLRTDLVAELRRSMAFYRTIGPLPESLRLRISGGSARLPGLAARMGELLGIAVEVFNPVAGLPGEALRGLPTSEGPQYGQAYGLALRTW